MPHDATPYILAVADAPAKEMPPKQRLAIRQHAFLMLWLLLGLLAIFVIFFAFARSRRNARIRAMKAETARKRQALQDAWAEAGKRVEAPDPEEMENDRLNLDDTDMDGREPPRG